MSVFDSLVGQPAVVAVLQDAAAAAAVTVRGEAVTGMTHAWLFTGPPGSGRSVAARAFAAALQCADGGGGHCHECRTALAGRHADVTGVATELLSIKTDQAPQPGQPPAPPPPKGGRGGHHHRGAPP